MKVTKTLYWDPKDSRFVYVVWDGERARHHKIPRDVTTEAAAKRFVKKHNLGMEFFHAA